MKKLLFFIVVLLLIVSIPSRVFSQPMVETQREITSDDHTAGEEREGKDIWDSLQSKQLTCNDLTDENFEALGEYFMGQAIGNTERHAAMNHMMTNMIGEDEEKQMHITLGKRSSGCDTRASLMGSAFSRWAGVGGTRGGVNPMMGYWGNTMMGGSGGFGAFGWISMLLFWLLIILGIIALVRNTGGWGKTAGDDKTPLEILKERYAKGEIDKKEFEEKKKDVR